MEKVQKNSSTSFFGSEPVSSTLVHILHSYDMFLAQQQASLGGDRQNHAEPFQ